MERSPLRVTFSIPALDCPDELALIERALASSPGIVALEPNYLTRRLTVAFDPQQIEVPLLTAALRRTGFAITTDLPVVAPTTSVAWPRPPWWVLLASALLVAALVGQAILGSSAGVTTAAVLATFLSGVPVAQAALRSLRLWVWDMYVLMTIAAIGALAMGDVFEAATAMVLFGVAQWLERLSLFRARAAVESLLNFTPRTAHRLEHGHTHDVEPAQIQLDDHLQVRPGERFPVDGVILSGETTVNEAPLTGESLPVDKRPEDRVFAGSLNGEGSVELRATSTAANSTLAAIARLVGEAHATRSPTQRLVDRFARWYTPAVIVLAVALMLGPPLLAGGSWHTWLHRALVMLVAACPCALVLSTPVTIVCGLHRAATRGIVIKGGEHLEAAGAIEAILFDKTGTLSRGQAEIVALHATARTTSQDVLRWAAALEAASEHPLARTIVAAAQAASLDLPSVAERHGTRGLGIAGLVEGRRLRIGRLAWLGVSTEQIASTFTDPAPSAATTHVGLVDEEGLLGLIELADAPRDDARAAIDELQLLGIRHVGLVTGDRRPAAERLAQQLGISAVHAELLPDEKQAVVRDWIERFQRVAMVGDGVNDAPALAAAPLGIALGQGASDTALETADVVLLGPHVQRVGELIRLGRRCRALLTQNITLALGVKLGTLALASQGWASMALAVVADVGASLLVIFNGMRILNGSRADHD